MFLLYALIVHMGLECFQNIYIISYLSLFLFPDCKRSPRVLQVRPHLSYYRYNVGNRRCEPSYLFTKEIKWQKIPGYLNAHMCKICTLFSFCEQSGDSLDALESIFNFEETVLKDFHLPEGENKVV